MRLAFAKRATAKRQQAEHRGKEGRHDSPTFRIPADWQDATGNDALQCNDCGYPKLLVWVRLGDMGEYESFDSLDDALDCLNELKAGEVAGLR